MGDAAKRLALLVSLLSDQFSVEYHNSANGLRLTTWFTAVVARTWQLSSSWLSASTSTDWWSAYTTVTSAVGTDLGCLKTASSIYRTEAAVVYREGPIHVFNLNLKDTVIVSLSSESSFS